MKKSPTPLRDAIKSVEAIMDGMNGWISEAGESELWNFWKRDVIVRYDNASTVPINRGDAYVLLSDLIEGLEGVVSEQGEVPTRYWKKTVLTTAKKRANALKEVLGQ